MSILVTGAAGFIGFHVSKRLLEEGHSVIGLDNLNNYYDVSLKKSRLNEIEHKKFNFINCDLQNIDHLSQIFKKNEIKKIINLAAQAGVRYSITNPQAYLDSNIHGFLNILECARNFRIEHLVYASSSSVYGMNETLPFSVSDNVDHPVSLYAASKKSNELMAHAYSHLYDIPTSGLRFFTVYGPWGRPDMACFIFTKAILEDRPIKIFNHGDMMRDFTYIDDIVLGITKITDKPPKPDQSWTGKSPNPSSSSAPYRVFNIGNNEPVKLDYFIQEIENALSKKAIKEYLPMQPGDVPKTFADIDALEAYIGFKPATPIHEGIGNFVKWYRGYYKV